MTPSDRRRMPAIQQRINIILATVIWNWWSGIRKAVWSSPLKCCQPEIDSICVNAIILMLSCLIASHSLPLFDKESIHLTICICRGSSIVVKVLFVLLTNNFNSLGVLSSVILNTQRSKPLLLFQKRAFTSQLHILGRTYILTICIQSPIRNSTFEMEWIIKWFL